MIIIERVKPGVTYTPDKLPFYMSRYIVRWRLHGTPNYEIQYCIRKRESSGRYLRTLPGKVIEGYDLTPDSAYRIYRSAGLVLP